jgi:hypothetical protein
MKTKRALLIAPLLLVASGTQAQFIASPYYAPKTTATEGLRGPVKELELQELLVFEDGEIYYEDTLYLHFNEEGLLIERNSLWHEEYPYSKYLYTDGKLTEVKSWSSVDSTTTQYHYSPDGCVSYAVTYFYEHGNLVEYDTSKYRCDSLCRITMEIFDNSKDTVRCTYDRHGRMTKWCNWERCEEGCDGCTEYIYDDQGRLIKEQHRHRYSIGEKEYFYNEEGYVSDLKDSFALEEHTHYDYTYDSHGNWLTRTNGNTIIRRKITYYE